MKANIVLDSGPLGLLMQRRGLPVAETCRSWLFSRIGAGARILVPEIADYEVRRELLRLGKNAAIARLDTFISALPDRYLPLTTPALPQAAELWADVRRRGLPTASPKELDGDVILAAQVMVSAIDLANTVVATSNPVHLSRFLAADDWVRI